MTSMANMTNWHSHNPVGRTISACVALGDEHAQIRFEPVLYDPNLLRRAGALSRVPIIAPNVNRDDKTGEVRRQRRDHKSMTAKRRYLSTKTRHPHGLTVSIFEM